MSKGQTERYLTLKNACGCITFRRGMDMCILVFASDLYQFEGGILSMCCPYVEDVVIGREAEACVLRGLMECGWTPNTTDTVNDQVGLFDLGFTRVQGGIIELMFPDVKSTDHPVNIKYCLDGRNAYSNFLVEYWTEKTHEGTNFSAEGAPVTHLIYAIRKGKQAYTSPNGVSIDRMPFMIVRVDELREFFLSHRNNPKAVKRVYGYEHAYNLSMSEFLKAGYGFDHYYYDGWQWQIRKYGRGTSYDIMEFKRGTPDFSTWVQWLNAGNGKKLPYVTNEELYERFKEDEDRTAARKFHGDKTLMKVYIERHRLMPDEKYLPTSDGNGGQ